MKEQTLATYYQEHRINPVPLDILEIEKWEVHLAKRRNLYENHLGIPLALLRDRSVIEFGCNSGENPLVLAHYGADLTLVEPNGQVFPRLKSHFEQFGLQDRIADLVEEQIEDYQSQDTFDLVICEGFISNLQRRDEAVKKLVGLLSAGGVGVLSFDCVYGHFIEMTKKYVFHRACRSAGIKDLHCEESLAIARELFLEDFERISASRPFTAWWQDVLLNPFVAWNTLWNFHEIINLIDEAGGEFASSSPRWSAIDQFSWYKNISPSQTRHEKILDEWYENFSYFLTGIRADGVAIKADGEVMTAVSDIVKAISDYVAGGDGGPAVIEYPAVLKDYLGQHDDSAIGQCNRELEDLYGGGKDGDCEEIIASYHGAVLLRDLWGITCPYISFRRS
jgi:SAM-dependent methyltransferase